MSMICLCIGFYSVNKIPVKVTSERSKTDRSKSDTQRKKVDTTEEDMKESETYHKMLTSTKVKVKSISQYGKKGQKSSKEKSDDKSDDKNLKRTSSHESIGEGYFKQLMKGQTKVKSISQY